MTSKRVEVTQSRITTLLEKGVFPFIGSMPISRLIVMFQQATPLVFCVARNAPGLAARVGAVNLIEVRWLRTSAFS
jgi:hypothetical protein